MFAIATALWSFLATQGRIERIQATMGGSLWNTCSAAQISAALMHTQDLVADGRLAAFTTGRCRGCQSSRLFTLTLPNSSTGQMLTSLNLLFQGLIRKEMGLGSLEVTVWGTQVQNPAMLLRDCITLGI